MKLINVDSNFSVESFKLGNKTVEFVHDKNTGYNYFPQAVLSDLFGINQSAVSKQLNNYLKTFDNFIPNRNKIQIKLKTSNRGRKTVFYGFDAVSYLAFKIDTPNAIQVRETISDILDTMFNVVTGKTDLDTKLDKLRVMQEVEDFKAGEYLESYKHLIKFDEELANKSYHKYKISKNNAFNCHELLMAKRDWDKRYNEVRDTIEPRKNGSKQLLLF